MLSPARAVARTTGWLDRLQDPLLLAIRLYWGWSLMWNGWGKFHHLPEIARWFGEDLGLPFPMANAIAAASVELVGSALVMMGLGARAAAAAIAFVMTVAYLTSDREAVTSLATDFFCYDGQALGDCFTLAAPFPYWFMGVLVLVFGPGRLSVDAVLAARAAAQAPSSRSSSP